MEVMRPAAVVALLAAAGVCGLASSQAPGRRSRPNVLLVVIDTLRADRIDRAAWLGRQAGTAFTNAWSQAPTTNSAIATLFTGLLPTQHGVFDGGGELPRTVTTLSEHFRGAGYATAHITANPNSGPPYALDRGFQHVRWSGRGAGSALLHRQLQHAPAVAALATEFLQRRTAPFLLSLHFNDPHSPYDPVQAPAVPLRTRRIYDEPASDPAVGTVTARERADILARYDVEIRTVDAALEHIAAVLQAQGSWADTLVVVTADHGEEFGDHGGWGHSHALHPELLRVPLFIRTPGTDVRRSEAGRINHADLLPTILDLAGLPPAAGLWGRSRAGLVGGRGSPAAVTIAEKLSTERGPVLRTAVTDSAAIVEQQPGGELQLYDRRADPAQRRSLTRERPAEARRLRAAWLEPVARLRRPEQVRPAVIDADTLRHLQSLGYLQGRTATTGAAVGNHAAVGATIKAILDGWGSAPAVWSLASGDAAVAGDSATRGYDVQIAVSEVRAGTGPVRLRLAAAEQATTISEVSLRAARAALARPVTFGGARTRRIPAGGILESDPVARPPGSEWVVTFQSNPLGLLRVAARARTTVLPAGATFEGSLGLVGIADAGP